MQLKTVLKYYLLTVIVSVTIPFWVMGTSSNINPLKEIAIVIGMIAAANLPQFLLLIKTGFKTGLAIVPFVTVIPSITLFYAVEDPRSYMTEDIDRMLALIVSAALNFFVLVYAYEKLLAGKSK
jgi:hypothetical protein